MESKSAGDRSLAVLRASGRCQWSVYTYSTNQEETRGQGLQRIYTGENEEHVSHNIYKAVLPSNEEYPQGISFRIVHRICLLEVGEKAL